MIVNGTTVPLTGRELLAVAFLYFRAKEGKAPYPHQSAAVGDYLKFVEQWQKNLPKHHSLQRKVAQHSAGDLTKAFHSLRKKLRARGLSAAIPYLCPKESRVHFDVVIGGTSERC